MIYCTSSIVRKTHLRLLARGADKRQLRALNGQTNGIPGVPGAANGHLRGSFRASKSPVSAPLEVRDSPATIDGTESYRLPEGSLKMGIRAVGDEDHAHFGAVWEG